MLKEIKEYYNKHGNLPLYINILMRNGFSFNNRIIGKYFKSYNELCKQATGVKVFKINASVLVSCANCSKEIRRSGSTFLKSKSR